MDLIIGASGFIGSNLARELPSATHVSRQDLKSGNFFTGSRLFIAAPSASKWLVNQEPASDLQNIETLFKYVKTYIETVEIILISTIDVYEDPRAANEDSPTLNSLNYGGNRKILEDLLGTLASNLRVARFGGLFGQGLKKNILFDLHNLRYEELIKYNAESLFQYLSVERSIRYLLESNEPLVNVVGPPLRVKDMAANRDFFSDTAPLIEYNVSSVHLEGGYLIDRESAILDIESFLGEPL
jgi:nucleoside-diphosphate-sugar epimerase